MTVGNDPRGDDVKQYGFEPYWIDQARKSLSIRSSDTFRNDRFR